ncbi:MAG: DNA repair protein RecO, partial [Candidatus Andersenbacteria bacterium RIFCSPLOWO2_02_FULL_46_11]
ILRRKSRGEADRVVWLLTKRHGKVQVIAKGVRKNGAKRGAHIELFNTIKAQIIEGKAGLILGQTELMAERSGLKSDLKLMRIGFSLVEVVDRMTPFLQSHPELFDLLDRALSSVSLDKWKNEDRLTQAFAEKVLKLTGFGIPKGVSDLHLYIEELVESRLRSQEILRE